MFQHSVHNVLAVPILWRCVIYTQSISYSQWGENTGVILRGCLNDRLAIIFDIAADIILNTPLINQLLHWSASCQIYVQEDEWVNCTRFPGIKLIFNICYITEETGAKPQFIKMAT